MDENHKKIDDTQNRLASIGQISAGIAHEIRNPLTAVKGFLQLIQKEYSCRHWDIVNSELEQAISTVQNLLTVSKPDLDDESCSHVPLCALIESTLSLFHNEMYRVKIVKRFYNTGCSIYGKRNQLKRALFNLFKNSFEAIEGSGTLYIEHFKTEDHIHLIIRDTGKGIPKDKLQLLGTPFFSTKAESGTGLGLAQVYATFYEHGASIEVDSTEGEGTQFTIQIPISAQKMLEGNIDMNLEYIENMDVREFFAINGEAFNKQLEAEAKATFEIVEKSKFVTKRDLVDHANQIVTLIHDGLTQEIIALAQERGVAWAKSDVPIVTKMEWFYALRKVIWKFLRFYHLKSNIQAADVFELSDRINDALDSFIIHFNVSFTRFRDDLLKSKQAIIDELAVPLIPIFNQIAVLPLYGSLDESRIQTLLDRLLDEVESKGIHKLFIDLSAAVISNADHLNLLVRIIDGMSLLGCKAVLTGVSSKLAKLMLTLNLNINEKAIAESTLQHALAKESISLTAV